MSTATRSRTARKAPATRSLGTDPGEPPRAATTGKPKRGKAATKAGAPGQVVLVLQGGGALGAYQVGVYQALHEAGIEPDWVIGTSIGAINAALICGNAPEHRLDRLDAFWGQVEQQGFAPSALDPLGLAGMLGTMSTVLRGIPSFFTPNLAALRGTKSESSVEQASYYSTAPLRGTLDELVDWKYLCDCKTRLTVGAVNVCTGQMRYFDTREEPLGADHVMASGALPPAFGAVRIDGQPYWDGGIYSNTPIEGRARRQAAARLADLRGQRLAPEGVGAEVDLGSDGAHQGHPVREPRRQPHRPAKADPSPAST